MPDFLPDDRTAKVGANNTRGQPRKGGRGLQQGPLNVLGSMDKFTVWPVQARLGQTFSLARLEQRLQLVLRCHTPSDLPYLRAVGGSGRDNICGSSDDVLTPATQTFHDKRFKSEQGSLFLEKRLLGASRGANVSLCSCTCQAVRSTVITRFFATMGCPTPAKKFAGLPGSWAHLSPRAASNHPGGESIGVNPAAGHPAPGPAKTVFSKVCRRSPRACRLC